MQKCHSCDGFIPVTLKKCPNCRSKKVISSIKCGASVVGASMISLTLMACYGAPPDYYISKLPKPPCEENCENPPEGHEGGAPKPQAGPKDEGPADG